MMNNRANLGEFEMLAMLAILRLAANAYGTTIRREIVDATQRDVAIAQLYTTFDRLEAKGFIASRQGEPTPERGGRAKKYFNVTKSGQQVLNEMLLAYQKLSRKPLVLAEA
jgi:DNA-binding PadR family transcriptional regulator